MDSPLSAQDGEPPISPTRPAERLRQLGLRARKGLSQSFLADAGTAQAIVATAKLDPKSDDVLEVGPGLGVLTERLLRSARRVVAVELDPHLAEWLRVDLASPNLTVIQQDVLKLDPSETFDSDYVVVANLPYRITSPALRHLLQAGPPYARRLVLMVQKEVAERIAARPRDLSALAVATQAQARVRLVRRVPSGAFYPRPKVDSAVLLLEPLADDERLVPRSRVVAFTDFLHAGFAQPRKTLANSLAQGLRRERAAVLPLIEEQGIDPRRRPQDLSLEEWARLFQAVTA